MKQRKTVFLFLENKTVFKISKDGKVVFQLQMEAGIAFSNQLFTTGLKLVTNSNCLILDRYILKEDNEVVDIEKALKSEIKQKYKVNFTINSSNYSPAKKIF